MNLSIRKIFYLIIILAFAVTAAVVVLYKKVNLDDYRHNLEQQLSSSLNQPVSIGRGKLTFRKGVALDLRELRIGKEDSPLVEVPRLTATLQIAPLLEGQIILDQVLIEKPSLQIWLPIENRPARGTTHKIFDALGIRILTVRDANLRIHRRLANGQSKQLLRINDFNAVLKGWQNDQFGQLVISGQIQQKAAPANFILDFSRPSSPDPATWRLEQFKYQLTLQNLSTEIFPSPHDIVIPKAINLSASLNGVPAKGAVLFAEIRNGDDRDKFFELAGQWISTPERETLDKLTGSLVGLPISGEGSLQRTAERHLLSGHLEAAHHKINRQILELWHALGAKQLLGGELDRLALTVTDDWPAQQKIPGWPRIGLKFALRDLEWDKPELKQLENVSLQLALENQELSVSDGKVVIGGHNINYSGKIGPLTENPQLDLDIHSEPDLAKLDRQLQLPKGWSLAGSLPIRLHLSGPLRQPNFLLEADLANSQLTFGQLLQKSSSRLGSLRLSGLIDQQQLQLDQLRLRLGDFQMSGHGSIPWQSRGASFRLDIDPFELFSLQALSPLLNQLKLQGELKLALNSQDSALQGTLRLRNIGCHFFNIVGDLNHATGELLFDDQGLKFHNFAAQLGESPLILDGSLAPWAHPQLSLNIKGNKVRAQDLIFPNRELWLYDLDGRLRINSSGIFFEPVKVRLGEDTTAQVSGKVENFKDPQTILDIVSKQADIQQVIDLFRGPRKSPPQKRNHELKPTIISVKVAQGTLGGLHVNNAEGVIKDHAGVFTIYPLKFETGGGTCLARIEFDRNHPHDLLKISGHAENVDATILHQDLFKARGLIKGPLRGDFYVEGSPENGNFWGTALGGIHLQVKNGTLRKFHGLASVFSILNVSQLFTFQLPDIDKEGMPFSLLEGSMRIANGEMETEDTHVVSEAMNLSLVGKQSLVEDRVDYHLGVMPLRTVDKVVTSIPIAGWLLAGENKAIFTAYFKIEGPSASPKVTAVPVDSLSDTVFGVIKRTFGLPGKLVKDIGSLFKSEPKKKE
jgi:AsmA-like C-terminal region/AsmA family